MGGLAAVCLGPAPGLVVGWWDVGLWLHAAAVFHGLAVVEGEERGAGVGAGWVLCGIREPAIPREEAGNGGGAPGGGEAAVGAHVAGGG